MKLVPTLSAVLAIALAYTISGCSNNSAPTTPPDSPPTQATPDSLDKMAAVFQGGYTREQIKATLDQVMPMYGSPINEDSYRRCGSVLVEMTKKTGVPEMDQLRYMMQIQKVAPGGGMNFADGAALAASSLSRKPQ